MAIFTANVDAALNQRREDKYEQNIFSDSPLLGLIHHGKKGGDAIKVTFKTGFSPGVGARYADMAALIGETKRSHMLVTPSVLYAAEDVDNVSAIFSENDEDAVVDILGDAQDGAQRSAAAQVDQALFSDGSGSLFTVSSHTGTTGAITLTATIPSQVFKIQVGQTLVSKATPFAASLDTGTILVTGVSQTTGVVSGTAQAGYDATSVNGNVVGLSATMAASTELQTYLGLPGWITNDATILAASIFGLVRTNLGVFGSGHVIDCTNGVSIKDAVNLVIASISMIGGAKPDLVLLNSTNYNKLQTDLGSAAVNVNSKGNDITINYEGFSWIGPKGKLTCHMAPNCSAGDVWVLQSDSWHITAPGKDLVIPSTLSGGWIPLTSADATRVSMRAAGSFYCDFPAANGRALVTP